MSIGATRLLRLCCCCTARRATRASGIGSPPRLAIPSASLRWTSAASVIAIGHRTIALDTLSECWSSDVDAVVDRLGLAPVILVGLSAGGATAMHYTANNPEKVDRVVVVEFGPVVARAGVSSVIKSIPSREEFDGEEDAVRYLVRSTGRSDPAMAREHALHSLNQLENGRLALKGDPALRRRDWRRPIRSVEENWSAVRRITRPALLIRGGDSKFLTVETAEQMQREIADCTLVTIPGAGHTVPMHRPTEFEEAVRAWLARPLA